MKKQKINQQWECIYFLRPEIISSAKFVYKDNPPPSPESGGDKGDKGKRESPLGPLGDAVAKSGTVLGTAFSIMDAALEAGEKSQPSINDYINQGINFARAKKTEKSTEAFRKAFDKADTLNGKDRVIAYKNLAEAIFGWYQAPDKLTTLQYLAGVASIIIDNMPLQDRIDAYEPLLHIVMHLYNVGDHTYSVEDVFHKKYLATADLMPSFDEKINAYRTIQVLAGRWGLQDVESLALGKIQETMAAKEKAGETLLRGVGGDVFYDYLKEAVDLAKADKSDESIRAFRDARGEADRGQNQQAKAMEYIILAKNIADYVEPSFRSQLASPQFLLEQAKNIAVQISDPGDRLKVYEELAPALKNAGLNTDDIFTDCFAIADSMQDFDRKMNMYSIIETLAGNCGRTDIAKRADEEREKMGNERLGKLADKFRRP